MAKKQYKGIDLFAGAGGMSVGAIAAGVDIKVAVECDKYAAFTYKQNHPNTEVFQDDIRNFRISGNSVRSHKDDVIILFGGPPCQGFSTSNQKNRDKDNENNWLFKEYLRVTKAVKPDWVVVENVKGIIETEGGFFFDEIKRELRKLGYTVNADVLNAADYGVPQIRNRVFIVGSLHGTEFSFPKRRYYKHLTVHDAIADLPPLTNGANEHELDYATHSISAYQKAMRKGSAKAYNNLVTRNNALVLKRYETIPPGGNWESIPRRLMKNYTDASRCHTGIYHRLKSDTPSVVIGNYRKNMLIHPTEHRGLSVREAARIQSFPDTFQFYGSIGFQQQQVGNSVPPLLAKAIFNSIIDTM